jgi:hypothetical protein
VKVEILIKQNAIPIYHKDYRRLSSKYDKIKVDVMKIISIDVTKYKNRLWSFYHYIF